ncbi:MAG: hypothetical protein ACYDC5_12570, partial [Candidatus Dormibacteria bacterium]
MDPTLLYEATQRLGVRTFAFLRQLDEAIKPLRGVPLLPSRVLVVGAICLGEEPGPKTITHLAKMMARASQGQLHMLYGTPVGPAHDPGPELEPPTEAQLYRLFDAMATVLGRKHRAREQGVATSKRAAAARRAQARRARRARELLGTDNEIDTQIVLSIRLLEDTAPPQPLEAPHTTDTTEIEADCHPVSQAQIKRGQFASDSDARWRTKHVGDRDEDAPGEKARNEKRKATGADPRMEPYLGFGDDVLGGTEGNACYVYAHGLFAANQYDVPVSLRLVELMKATGHGITELIADRGFSHDSNWLETLRRENVMPVFDLKSPQMKLFPTWKGCLVLPSGVYLPMLPQRLWFIERPKLQAPNEKTRAYREAIAERSIYALVPHGKATPGQVRLSSPVLRRRAKNALGCPKVPGSMRRRDQKLPVCDGKHGDDEACCIQTATLRAAEVPLIFQFPFWGTPEWEEKYAKRTNVERGFSMFKNPDVIGLTKGQFHYRHIPNVALLVTFMWGA